MTGRRWSDGLHQAVEAKEGVKVEPESVTYATVTLQNYYRMYQKLAGMTGTAETEASEFNDIYKLDVVVIPTNRPITRIDHPDLVYYNEQFKYQAICNEIARVHKSGQPILVGTISIEKSELISSLLKRMGIKHEVRKGCGHHRDEHGRARHRHQAGRQPRGARTGLGGRRREGR